MGTASASADTARWALANLVLMDDLDAGAQPRCHKCGVLMHAIARGDQCPVCGHRDEWPKLPPKPLDDPAIVDFPGAR